MGTKNFYLGEVIHTIVNHLGLIFPLAAWLDKIRMDPIRHRIRFHECLDVRAFMRKKQGEWNTPVLKTLYRISYDGIRRPIDVHRERKAIQFPDVPFKSRKAI